MPQTRLILVLAAALLAAGLTVLVGTQLAERGGVPVEGAMIAALAAVLLLWRLRRR